jgi:hypothetical protein
VAPEVVAAWAHVSFINISPFLDSNDRVARALTSLILMKAGGLPFHVSFAKKLDYLRCLHQALTTKNLSVFVEFIMEQQKAFGEEIANLEYNFQLDLRSKGLFCSGYRKPLTRQYLRDGLVNFDSALELESFDQEYVFDRDYALWGTWED